MPVGGLAWMSEPSSAATASTLSAPSAMATRMTEPIIDGNGVRRNPAVDGGLLDEQRLAATRLFHLAIGQLGDLQLGGQRLGDTGQLARLLEGVQKFRV